MAERKVLPFYMAYSFPMFEQEEDAMLRDLEYLQQLYPTEVKKYQKVVSRVLDKMDYEGSLIYDEYPCKWQLYRLSKSMLAIIKNEAQDLGIVCSPEKWEWMEDMIEVILFYEIYKRRHKSKRKTGLLKNMENWES